MNRILADVQAFGKQFLRSKIGAFFTFVFPILLILLFGALYSNPGSTSVSLPVQNLDGTPVSQTFLDMLNRTNLTKITMIPAGEDIQAYIKAHSLTLALYIPADFGQKIASNQTASVTLYGDTSQTTYGVAQGVLNAVIEQMNSYVRGSPPVVVMSSQSVVSSQFTFMDYFVPGIVAMTVMITAMYTMTSVCAEYRTRRYFKLLATTTLSKPEWLVSKILFYGVMTTLSLLVTVGVGIALWHVHVVIDPLSIVFILVGTFLFTSLGMLLGSAIKDPESSAAVANAIGFPMMFLSGTFWPITMMPDYIQALAQVLPLTYLNDGLRQAMVYGNMSLAAVDLGVLAVAGVAVFLIAARVMSWKER